MRKYDDLGIAIPEILLPKEGFELQKWAVVACDQYTSEPQYWNSVEKFVGPSPSTLKLIYPEVYLEEGEQKSTQRIDAINKQMNEYLQQGLLKPFEGMVYVERTLRSGKTRKGLVLALDLEKYDFNKGSTSLIRATEGTIVSRLPPRIKIRENAPIELPHIMVLIDDPHKTVIEPLATQKTQMEIAYDFNLMMDSGKLKGFKVTDEKQIVSALRKLADKKEFKNKYSLAKEEPVLLFAMGDGNHSLATAKALWEKIKPNAGMNSPARYALVEIVNIHDSALEFEAIHRVLFEAKKDFIAEMKGYFKQLALTKVANAKEMVQKVNSSKKQAAGIIAKDEFFVAEFDAPSHNLCVGTMQQFLDKFMQEAGAKSIDYVHGEQATIEIGSKPGNVGIYLPSMRKDELFKTVILDGVTPRKTFSMGEAHEKRFYMECRKIK